MAFRFSNWILQLLVALDQLAHVWLAGWTYVWLGRGECPSADETISSRVGRAAIGGRRWALVAERLIDPIFHLLRRQRGHCRTSVEWDELKPRRPGPIQRKSR